MKYASVIVAIPDEHWEAFKEQFREAGQAHLQFRGATVFAEVTEGPNGKPKVEIDFTDNDQIELIKKVKRVLSEDNYHDFFPKIKEFGNRAILARGFDSCMKIAAEYVDTTYSEVK